MPRLTLPGRTRAPCLIRVNAPHFRRWSATARGIQQLLPAALLLSSALLVPGTVSAQTSADPKVADQLIGLVWDGREFIAYHGEATGGLLNVSLDSKTVRPFAPSFRGTGEVYIAVSPGRAGYPRGYLYVSSNSSIYQLDPSGNNVTVFSSPPGASRIGYLAFDTVGAWGYQLLAVDDNGLLWTIGSNGTAHTIASFGKGMKPEGIAVAPPSFGSYAGYLFICLEYASRVVAIPPGVGGRIENVTQIAHEQPERILLVPPTSDLYVAMFGGTIFRVSAANLTQYVGSLVVITEGESGSLGSMTSLRVIGNDIVAKRFLERGDSPHFEGADFVPAPSATATATGGGQTSSASTASSAESRSQSAAGVLFFTPQAAVTVLAVIVAGVVVAVLRRRAR